MAYPSAERTGEYQTQAAAAISDCPVITMPVVSQALPEAQEDPLSNTTMLHFGEPIDVFLPTPDGAVSRKQFHVMVSPAQDEETLNDAAHKLKLSLVQGSSYLQSFLTPQIPSSIEVVEEQKTIVLFAPEVTFKDAQEVSHVYYVLPTPQIAKLMHQKLSHGTDLTRVIRVPSGK